MRLINDQELLLVTGAGNDSRDPGDDDDESTEHDLETITQNADGTLSQGGMQTVYVCGNCGIEPINFTTPSGLGFWFLKELLKEALKDPNFDVNQDRSL